NFSISTERSSKFNTFSDDSTKPPPPILTLSKHGSRPRIKPWTTISIPPNFSPSCTTPHVKPTNCFDKRSSPKSLPSSRNSQPSKNSSKSNPNSPAFAVQDRQKN